MDIFYLEKDKFLNTINIESLKEFSDDREFASEIKLMEHLCGLFLTKFIAKNFYNVEDVTIKVNNHKPYFEFSSLKFSISHSKNMILVAFNNQNIGADVEVLAEKSNYKKIMDRLGMPCENPTLEEFYRFWTNYEASVKLASNVESSYSTTIKNYAFSCVSDEPLTGNVNPVEVVFEGENIDLADEYNNPKNCQLLFDVE